MITFSQALNCLKSGSRIARAGWNGKGMFLQLIKENEWKLPDTSVVNGAILPLLSFIGMKTADNKFVPWLASQTDILAEDWDIANEKDWLKK